MKSVLKELYYGNINPDAKCFVRDFDFHKALNTLIEKETKLIQRLDEEEKSLLTEFDSAHHEISDLSSMESFIEGFRLGARIMVEIMDD